MSALASSSLADQPTAADLAPDYTSDGEMIDAPAKRASVLSFDAFAGFYPRHSEVKLGAALVLTQGRALRTELQVADNVVGIGAGYRLPLSVFAESLSISVGAAVSWDTARSEITPSVYVARLIF